ncbi:hypothetical protein LEP3755_10690 [Leptolyngbya sp. NIES-3755]|nr:hypothetical protein LEP3755_10690 [Leptolyngbya sp. NIES-3755]
MKQSPNIDRLLTLSIAFLTVSTPFVSTQRANAQVQVLAPALCSTGVGCIFGGVATIGGIVYYVWQNQRTGDRFYQHIEEPEEHEQWGIFYAKNAWRCRQLAAGRPHRYDSRTKRCYIKG